MENLTTDAALLGEFARNQDGVAFEELVRRYLTMVLGVALRRTGNYGAAEEIAQNTFSILARKASNLRPDIVLGGWLHRVAMIEAADYNRKEYRRRKAMNEFKESSEIEEDDTVSEAFAELLPDLDVAMAALSNRERDAIMLRFHAGLRFAEMAKRLGKSEEAARKQVSRAVDKLALLLGRRRGSTVATATLVSGLPLALGQAEASVAMVQSVATSALSSLSASSSLTLKLFCLMKTQASIVAMIGILLVASSFFAGRQTAASFGRELIEQTEHQALYRQQFAKKADALKATLPLTARRTVEQILDDAASEYRDGSTSNSGYYRALLALSELDPGDYQVAITHLETQRSDVKVFEGIGALLAGLWASVDGNAAIVWVEQNLDKMRDVAVQNVLESWSKHEPETAYQWYIKKADSGDSGMHLSSFRWLSKRVFSGWAEKDPRGAVAALENVSVEDERGGIFGIASAVKHSLDPQPIVDAIAEMNDSPMRSKLVGEVAGEWAEEEPHSAAMWIDSIPMASAKERLVAKGEVAEEWFQHNPDDMLEIGAWFLTGAPEDMRDDLADAIANEIEKRQAGGGQ